MILRAADNTRPGSLASQLRRARVAILGRLASHFPEPVRVLDVGGRIDFWKEQAALLPKRCQITLLNLDATASSAEPDLVQVKGDARSMPHYADRSFDVCFSNSVIEHVGTLSDQMAMAREVRRVGKAYVVQTPNRYFPLEPHFLLPFWNFYPRALRRMLHTRFTLGWMKRQPDPLLALAGIEQVRLLNFREMQQLFPEAQIHRERIGPLTKSLIAVRGPGAPAENR